jgi:hypothetical protein
VAWDKDPKRVAINQHLHRMHEGFAASGDTLSRYVQHDLLHVDEWAGKPLHRHTDGLENFEVKDAGE